MTPCRELGTARPLYAQSTAPLEGFYAESYLVAESLLDLQPRCPRRDHDRQAAAEFERLIETLADPYATVTLCGFACTAAMGHGAWHHVRALRDDQRPRRPRPSVRVLVGPELDAPGCDARLQRRDRRGDRGVRRRDTRATRDRWPIGRADIPRRVRAKRSHGAGGWRRLPNTRRRRVPSSNPTMSGGTTRRCSSPKRSSLPAKVAPRRRSRRSRSRSMSPSSKRRSRMPHAPRAVAASLS